MSKDVQDVRYFARGRDAGSEDIQEVWYSARGRRKNLLRKPLHSAQNLPTISAMKNTLKQWTQLALLGSLLLLGQLVQAEMYKWVDEEGNVSYSDQPQHKDARKLERPSDNTIPAVDVPARTQAAPATPDKPETRYSSIQITSPAHNQTIRSNPGNITVSLSIQPALNVNQGHSISLLLDNQPVQENITTSQASLQNVDRGTHQLSATIKDKQGKTLKQSDTITFHLHRHSVLHPNAGQNQGGPLPPPQPAGQPTP